MRIYQDCLEMVKEVERDLGEMGIGYQTETVQDKNVSGNVDYLTTELNGYAYKLIGFKKQAEMMEYMKVSQEWADNEFAERILPELTNPGEAWKLKKEIWEQYLHNGEMEYSYNERIRGQIEYVVRELNRHRNTRQGILTIYDQHQDMRNWGGKARVPCSISYQFIIRGDSLNVIYNMRSCDFINHFSSDAYLAIKLGEYVANRTKSNMKSLTHFIGSLHAFKKDLDKRGIF